jgi:hypothetical protein
VPFCRSVSLNFSLNLLTLNYETADSTFAKATEDRCTDDADFKRSKDVKRDVKK